MIVASFGTCEVEVEVDEPGTGGGEAGGDIFSGTAKVGIFLLASGDRDPDGAQISYALVALHEFIHLAGGADQYGARPFITITS